MSQEPSQSQSVHESVRSESEKSQKSNSYDNIPRPEHDNATDKPNSGLDSGEERKLKRERLRKKFEQYLKESKATENNDRYKEALEKLKKDEDAQGFNLVCRTKGDLMTGLIILNRLSGSKPRKNVIPATTIKKVADKEEMKPTVTKEIKKEPRVEEPLTTSEIEEELRKPRIRKVTTVSARKARTSTRSPKDPNEVLIKGLSNKVDALWRKLDDMKQKKKTKKLRKMAKKALKQDLLEATQQNMPKTAKEIYYEALDQASSRSSNNLGNNKYYYKNFY